MDGTGYRGILQELEYHEAVACPGATGSVSQLCAVVSDGRESEETEDAGGEQSQGGWLWSCGGWRFGSDAQGVGNGWPFRLIKGHSHSNELIGAGVECCLDGKRVEWIVCIVWYENGADEAGTLEIEHWISEGRFGHEELKCGKWGVRVGVVDGRQGIAWDAVDGGEGGCGKELDIRKGRGGGIRVGDGMASAGEEEVIDGVGVGGERKE